LENNVEDPLSEELLKGEFQGKDTITVQTKKVGGKTQLVFESSVTEPQEDPPKVGAAASDSETDENNG
jgi:ATP-dependent Clp protease ATP-binding subunit ClpC